MTKEEVLKLALEALERYQVKRQDFERFADVITAIKEALAQSEQCQCPNCKVTLHASDCAVHSGPAYPAGGCDCGAQQGPEFFTHNVEQPYDWSEWVCPDPKGYLMRCCDCGLVHEAEFGVVRYKSETEREDCDRVDDPNLQAVFRMRRSEQWSPEDTAHRAGGMPMAQPEQEPVAWMVYTQEGQSAFVTDNPAQIHPSQRALPLYATPQQRTWVGLSNGEMIGLSEMELGRWDLILEVESKLREKNFD